VNIKFPISVLFFFQIADTMDQGCDSGKESNKTLGKERALPLAHNTTDDGLK
jgi:hypothetical protein